MARFVNAQVPEVVQPFWAALQGGEFIADAAFRRDRVDQAIRPTRLGLRPDDGNELVALEPVEQLVEVPDVQRAPVRADAAVERALQLVAEALAVGEQERSA